MNGIITVNLTEEKATLCAANVDKNCDWEKVEFGLSCLRQMGIQCFAVKQDLKGVAHPNLTSLPEAAAASVFKKNMPALSPKLDLIKTSSNPPQDVIKKPATKLQDVMKKSAAKSPQDVMMTIRNLLEKQGFSAVLPYLNNKSTLYLSDTGGQIEFQELLPLLVAGFAIFVFLFPLNKNLDEPVTVSYRKKVGGEVNEYTSSLTIKESLLQTLASIDSMETNVNPKHNRYVFLIGTYKDCLVKEFKAEGAEKKIAEINNEVKKLVKEHKYEQLVVHADQARDQVFFAVDNTCHNDAFAKIRLRVRNLLHPQDDQGKFQDEFRSEFHVKFPLSYLLASLHLQDSSEDFIKRSDFAKEVVQYGIKEEDLDHLLQFLHTRIGQIRYFPLDEEIREVIVKEPQALYNLVTYLLTKSFISQSKNMKEYSEVQRGIYSLESFDIEDFLSKSKFLTPKQVIHLLKELRIVAPFYDRAAGVEKYFIPCVLNHLPESPVDHSYKTFTVQPLAIMFSCGHCPKGIFGVLLHYILTMLKWNLDIDKISRDQVSFKVGLHSEVTIKLHPAYLEVRCSPTGTQHDQVLTLKNVCNKIRSTLESGIEPVRKSLHYSEAKMEYKLGLVCAECCQIHEVDEYSVHCPKRESCSLPNSGSFWFAIPTCFIPELSGKNNTVVMTRGRGSQIKFSIDSDTPTKHKLFREGSPLSGNHVYLEDAATTICFKNIRESDEGTYVICSTNTVGQSQASFVLKTKAPPKYCLQDDYLKAEAGSNPTVTFTMTSGLPLAENVEHILLNSDGSRAPKRFKIKSNTIIFQNVQVRDSGTYILTCDDAEGQKIEAAIELKVTSRNHLTPILAGTFIAGIIAILAVITGLWYNSSHPPAVPSQVDMACLSIGVNDIHLKQLYFLQYADKEGKSKKLRIIEEIASKWEELGVELGCNVNTIALDRNSVEDRCKEVLKRWLRGECESTERYPVSWNSFIKAVKNVGLLRVALTIELALECVQEV